MTPLKFHTKSYRQFKAIQNKVKTEQKRLKNVKQRDLFVKAMEQTP